MENTSEGWKIKEEKKGFIVGMGYFYKVKFGNILNSVIYRMIFIRFDQNSKL